MDVNWRNALEALLGRGSVIVGIGNRLRGDDAFGPVLLDVLRGRVRWPLVDAGDAPENYTGAVLALNPKAVLLVDAARWGAAPGSLGVFSPRELGSGGVSTHSASLRLFSSVVEERCGCSVMVLAAEPETTAFGMALSGRMRQAVAAVASCLAGLDPTRHGAGDDPTGSATSARR